MKTSNKITRVQVGRFGVDSGQFLIVDPCYLGMWHDNEFEDIRIYECTDGSGKRLQFRVDFENYEQPIEAEGGKSMNQLNTEGSYSKVEEPKRGSFSFSYDGACQATLSQAGGGELIGGPARVELGVACRTAYGDGVYPVYQVFNADGELMRVEIDFTE